MNDTTTKSFSSNIGSPQGVALSGLLFDIYFENSLRKFRVAMIENSHLIEHSYVKTKVSEILTEVTHACDGDYCYATSLKMKACSKNIIE